MAKKVGSNRGRGRPPLERPDYSKADPAHIAECANFIRGLLMQRTVIDNDIALYLKHYEKSFSVDPVALKQSVILGLKLNPKRALAEQRKADSLARKRHYLEVLQVIEFDEKGQGTFLSAA